MTAAVVLCATVLAAACKNGIAPSVVGASLDRVWHTPLIAGDAENLWSGVPGMGSGRVYVQAGNQLFALSAATGTILWKARVRDAPTPLPTTPLVAAGRVVVAELGHVMALAAASGQELWRFHPDSAAVVQPAIDSETIYTGQAGVAVVYAIDVADGSLRWRTNVGPDFAFRAWITGLASSGDTVYASVHRDLTAGRDPGGMLVALDARTGAVLWRAQPTGARHAFINRPVLLGRLVIVSDLLMPGMIAYDRRTGAEVWRAVGHAPAQAPFIQDGNLYFGSWGAMAVAVEGESGKVLWASAGRSFSSGSAICGTKLFVNDGDLRAYDLSSGRYLGSMSAVTGDLLSGLATDGKLVFVTGADGAYAFRC